MVEEVDSAGLYQKACRRIEARVQLKSKATQYVNMTKTRHAQLGWPHSDAGL